MIKIILFICLFGIILISNGQNYQRINIDSLTVVNSQRIKLIENDIINFKYSSSQYHKQMVNSYILFGIGTSIICSPLVIDNQTPSNQNIIIGVGTVVELIGLINTIDALKWFKYMSINRYGVGIKFNL